MSNNVVRGACGKVAVLLAAAGLLGACGSEKPESTAAQPTSAGPEPAALAAALEHLVTEDQVPGAQAVLGLGDKVRVFSHGVGDIATGKPFPTDARIRIGSNTKTFVATVALQLVGEGKLSLDAPVDQYLPGVVHGESYDPKKITVRNILQHTSGIPDYLEEPEFDEESSRYKVFQPAQLADLPFARHPADFAPGAKFEYSNTNYILAGMVIEEVTGQPVAAEIKTRIADRLGLKSTFLPAPGDIAIPDPHPSGYALADAGKPVEFTEQDPSWAGAAGAMISTGRELNRFYVDLLNGKLLPPAQLAEMQRTVPADEMSPGFQYGLGLARIPSSCGKEVWGHGGTLPGFRVRNGYTKSGDAATLIVNEIPAAPAVSPDMIKAVDTALCAN
ncbi:serine hydrolase domain-containing protein [Nocardia panacis]|uniref:serine hydrolase domain-containing protein n=1 Tax=Nocardia panacis TaxID=2340916 RepID=UPI0013153ACE|nr:serine hydrolase domain-containing protein [Nocardia panacis]